MPTATAHPPAAPPKSRLLPVLLAILALSVVALVKLRYVLPYNVTSTVAPGLTLTTTQYNRLSGGVKTYIVHAAKDRWRPRIVAASANVLTREPTSAMAAAVRAPVAVNGGYFAYGVDGAPVGPLRIHDEWLRLPWKNRTTLGLKAGGAVKIDNLSARAFIELPGGLRLPVTQLNGHAASDALTLLTTHFRPWTLTSVQSALVIPAPAPGRPLALRRVTSGVVALRPSEMALIADGRARGQLDAVPAAVGFARLKVELTPADWEAYPDILGAGPRLLRGGAIANTEREEEFKPDVVQRGPRTALGLDARGDWILLVADGRQMPFEGLTNQELAEDLREAGAVDALSLDGGNSATLVVNGQVENSPSAGGEVLVSNAVALVPVGGP